MGRLQLRQALDEAIDEVSGSAGRSLLARINALSVFESRGVPISERPQFSANLPHQAYQKANDYLLLALKYLDVEDADGRTDQVLEMAGELLEKLYSAIPDSSEKAEGLYNAALAYYLSGHYARAYVIMKGLGKLPDTPDSSTLLRLIFLKRLSEIKRKTRQLLSRPVYSDSEMARALATGKIGEGTAIDWILEATFSRAVALFVEHTRNGSEELIARALALLNVGIKLSIDQTFFNWWWRLYCARAMLQEYTRNSFWTVLKPMLEEDQSGLVRRYIKGIVRQSDPVIEMWRTQVQAFEHMNDPERSSYCIKMPTSAGKTRIAETAILRFLLDDSAEDKKCLYIAPYRALALELEKSLAQSFESIGVKVSELYGGFDLNPVELQLFEETRILIATPEKADAFLRYTPKLADQIGLIVIDEGHIIDSNPRGLRYEMFLHRVVRRFADQGVRVLFVSAVMPSADQFTLWITGREAGEALIESNWRASQLYVGVLTWDGTSGRIDYLYRGLEKVETPMFIPAFVTAFPTQELRSAGARRYVFPGRGSGSKSEIVAVAALKAVRIGPTLIFAAQPQFVESIAKSVLEALSLQTTLAEKKGVKPEGLPLSDNPADSRVLENCIRLAEETTGPNSLMVRALRAGFVIHHGDIPKVLRVQLELLARERIISLTIATNTLAQGVNLPVRNILVHSLVQGKDRFVSSADFWNICGRAGRAMRENEGLILLVADETNNRKSRSHSASEEARRLVQYYIDKAHSHSVVSGLKVFLEQVLKSWRVTYPHASVALLCERLAANHIQWLSDKDQRLLEIVDSQLLALFEEAQAAEITPDLLETLFERSMLLLQLRETAPSAVLTVSTVIDLLTARVQYIQRVTKEPKRRRQFYRMGLTLSDCEFIRVHREEIAELLEQADDYDDWSPSERVTYLTSLCKQYLMVLSDIRPSAKTLPECWPQILQQWLSGNSARQMMSHALIASKLESAMQVSAVIDDLCDYRLPWGLNALFSFVEVEREQEVVVDSDLTIISQPLPSAVYFFPAMVRHGVHSQAAALLLMVGLESRQLAIAVAEHYEQRLEISPLLSWLNSLTLEVIKQWGLDSDHQDTFLDFIERVRERYSLDPPVIQEPVVFQFRIPQRYYASPLVAGTEVMLQKNSPGEFSVYSPAVDRLGTIQIEDEALCMLIESEKVVGTILSDLKPAGRRSFEVTIALTLS